MEGWQVQLPSSSQTITWRLLEVHLPMCIFYLAFPSKQVCSHMTSSPLSEISLLRLSPLISWTVGLFEVAPSTENLYSFWDPQSLAFPSERKIATHLPISMPLAPCHGTIQQEITFPSLLPSEVGLTTESHWDANDELLNSTSETNDSQQLSWLIEFKLRKKKWLKWCIQQHDRVLRHQTCLLTHIPVSLLMGWNQGLWGIAHWHRSFQVLSAKLKGITLCCFTWMVLPKLCKLWASQNPNMYSYDPPSYFKLREWEVGLLQSIKNCH